MKKSLYVVALLALTCIQFTGCKKTNDEPDAKEDLSYVIKTYYRYESGNHIYKYTWTYDGYKETGYKYYYDGQLYEERNNYSYDGLKASYDSYTYRDSITYRNHYECEYLDETFQRTKYSKCYAYYPNPQDNHFYDIREAYYEYEGKKKTSYKTYTNGRLTGENHYNYEGLRCTFKTTYNYSSYVEVRNYDILYLDDTYLRTKTYSRTRERYDTDGNLTFSDTYYYANDYDGKKPIGYRCFWDGILSGIGRDYQYDGLTCYYYVDNYRDGEVISTQMYEVEYLE